MTEKSKLGFGKYADLTVGDVLTMGEMSYLAWCYYNQSNISFVDEILEQLGIEQRISKPGKDADAWEVWLKNYNDKIWQDLSGVEKIKLHNRNEKIHRYNIALSDMQERNRLKMTKGYLQRVNQGHQEFKK